MRIVKHLLEHEEIISLHDANNFANTRLAGLHDAENFAKPALESEKDILRLARTLRVRLARTLRGGGLTRPTAGR